MPIDVLLDRSVATLAAWLLTYSIHSTLLLGTAWLLTARAVRSITLHDLLWKVALVGGLITATLQIAGGLTPPALRLSISNIAALNPPAQLDAAPIFSSIVTRPATDVGSIPASKPAALLASQVATIEPSSPNTSLALTERATDSLRRFNINWPSIIVTIWLLGMAGALARLGVQTIVLRAALGQRQKIASGLLHSLLDQLRQSSGFRRRVRVSCSACITSPIALLGSEICLPERAIDGLSETRQRAMLAHELAHLQRRDPLWRVLTALIASLCFFQPLNLVARRRLHETAEYLCDDWAARRIGALNMAHCLAEVAAWLVKPLRLPIAPGMLGDGSQLIRRVERLLDTRRAAERRPRWRALLAIATLLCVGCGAPGVTVPELDVHAPSRASEQILFSSERSGVSDLYLMSLDGTSLRRLNINQPDPSLAAWSPDGGRIAFNSGRWPQTDIYVIDADGTNMRRLTSATAEDAHPTWSPDGRQIAFVSGRDGNLEIYVMDAEGRSLRRLTNNDDTDHKPVWSPDGKLIAFSSKHAGNVDIYVMGADGSNIRRLTDHSAVDMNPSWSPDGRQIAFNSSRAGNMELYMMDAGGGNVRRLLATKADAWDEKPTWSPNGAQLAFYSNRDGNADIYVVNLDGTDLRRLTADNTGFDGQPIWLPVSSES